MEKHGLLSFQISLMVILGFVLCACLPKATLPDPETASGVYVHSGFEFYRWEEGLTLMIWHDGIRHSNCSTTTTGQRYDVTCQAISNDNHSFDWRLETSGGKNGRFTIDGNLYDLTDGSLFMIASSSAQTEVRQFARDLSEVQPDAESVTQFGLSDSAILGFMQNSAEIEDCISSSTAPKESLESSDIESARQALIAFFSNLHEGDYESASALYGGGYEGMQAHNPSIDPDDHAALFRNACTTNGAQCLEVRQATFSAQPSAAEVQFIVEFANV